MATHFFSERVLDFFSSLTLKTPLPRGVQVLNPYQNKVVYDLCKQFYTKYYSDINKRRIIIGINPGRFGGGITGIPFTDPIKLQTVCNIKNDLTKKQELSSDFIYKMIAAYGGPELFYKDFYFTSVSPLGFTKDQKNLNYYDDPKLSERLKPFMLECMRKQLGFGINTTTAYCLGEGENYKFISRFNDEHHFFDTITPLPHPRFIMQYKLKSLNEYLDKYLIAFNQSS